MTGRQLTCWLMSPWFRTRSKPAKPAALATAAMYPVNGVGDPWYTSGVQKWKGTAATLNPSPTIRRPMPASRTPLLVRLFAGQEVGHVLELGGPGGAVDEGHSVQEDGRREGPQHEVLESGFARLRTAGGGRRPSRRARWT